MDSDDVIIIIIIHRYKISRAHTEIRSTNCEHCEMYELSESSATLSKCFIETNIVGLICLYSIPNVSNWIFTFVVAVAVAVTNFEHVLFAKLDKQQREWNYDFVHSVNGFGCFRLLYIFVFSFVLVISSLFASSVWTEHTTKAIYFIISQFISQRRHRRFHHVSRFTEIKLRNMPLSKTKRR